MAVTTVFQASDGKVFTNVNDARAYDAALTRKSRIIALLRSKRVMRTDTGVLKTSVEIEDVINWLTDDAAAIKVALA